MNGHKKRGRPPKPLLLHVRQGTYRRDRHGALPSAVRPSNTAPRAVETTITAALRDGAWLRGEVVTGWRVDDPAGLLSLDAAVVALDRIRMLDGHIDVVIPAVVAGQTHARILDALTKTRTAAVAELAAALMQLDLESVALPARGMAS